MTFIVQSLIRVTVGAEQVEFSINEIDFIFIQCKSQNQFLPIKFVSYKNLENMSNNFDTLTNQAQTNYYQILNIKPSASVQQICQSYKELALKYHPTLDHKNKNEAYKKFCEVSEAFDVLYDRNKRETYDKYGQQKLKQSIVDQQNQPVAYTFTTDPQQIFEKFFGSKNVYEHLLAVKIGERSHPIFSSQYTANLQDKVVQDLVVPVHCTLTELFNGCKKKMTYLKRVSTINGNSSQNITQIIQILPGASKNNPIVFEGQGNQDPGYQPSRLVFSIVQQNEKNFRREGNNLIYIANITLAQALNSESISVTQLNGEHLQLHFDQIISPQTARVIPERGMPIFGDQGKRGDLIIKFNIQFPEELSLQKKRRLIQLLKQ